MKKEKKPQTSATELKEVRKALAKAAKERNKKGNLYALSTDGDRFALAMLLKCQRDRHKLKMVFIVIKPNMSDLRAAEKVTFKRLVKKAMKTRSIPFLIPVKETLFKSLSIGDRFLYGGRIYEKTTKNPAEKKPTEPLSNEGYGKMVIPGKGKYERFCDQQSVWLCLASLPNHSDSKNPTEKESKSNKSQTT